MHVFFRVARQGNGELAVFRKFHRAIQKRSVEKQKVAKGNLCGACAEKLRRQAGCNVISERTERGVRFFKKRVDDIAELSGGAGGRCQMQDITAEARRERIFFIGFPARIPKPVEKCRRRFSEAGEQMGSHRRERRCR